MAGCLKHEIPTWSPFTEQSRFIKRVGQNFSLILLIEWGVYTTFNTVMILEYTGQFV